MVEHNVDRITQIDQGMSRTIEMTLEEVISGEMWDQISYIEDKIEIEIEKETIKIKIMREVGIDLEKVSIQNILEGMTEVVVVDLDHVQELVLVETGSDVINAENTITLLKTVWHQN